MNVKALAILIGQQRVGVLFQYALDDSRLREDALVVTRFVADDAFIAIEKQPVISVSYSADTPAKQSIFWRDVRSEPLNGRFSNKNGWLLPAFFQNLLPEGVFRDHVAILRGCPVTDNFELLAACGRDLPGNLYAMPVELSRDELATYVTQDQDALEMSVTADPMDEGVSLSGVQPKLSVFKQGGRYVGRTKDHDTHIIAKLPVVGQPMFPELEHLSLGLAEAAGVTVCETYLEPLDKLVAPHAYDLGEVDAKTKFLAVVRYDRLPDKRIHCEDFAQILGEMPEDKYGGLLRQTEPQTYFDIAVVLLSLVGEDAVHELLRRLAVNEMLGNPDMHLKNVGLWYPDTYTPAFPPAYDIVAYAANNKNHGHALKILPPDLMPRPKRALGDGALEPKAALSPAVLRVFCAELGIPEKPAAKAISDCVKAAYTKWPAMIAASDITGKQKERLLEHFYGQALVASLVRRDRAPVAAN